MWTLWTLWVSGGNGVEGVKVGIGCGKGCSWCRKGTRRGAILVLTGQGKTD